MGSVSANDAYCGVMKALMLPPAATAGMGGGSSDPRMISPDLGSFLTSCLK